MCAARLAAVLLCALMITVASATPGDDMVRVPAGPFSMGSDDGPSDERPAHTVELRELMIDRVPVTNAQYALFLNAIRWTPAVGPRLFDHDDPDARIHAHSRGWLAGQGFEHHPVVEVPWFGAVAYCAHYGKRLPTESEWEKAARGTDARRYPWGNATPDRSHAQFAAPYNATAPVGVRRHGASPYGALDMAGNVWQWVSSVYRPYPYRADDSREDTVSGPVRGTRG